MTPAFIFLLSSLAAQPPAVAPSVHYQIDAHLNSTEHILSGRSRVRFENHGPIPLKRAFFHLYPNRYRDRYSTAARERAFNQDYELHRIPRRDRGYLDVEQVRVDDQPAEFQILDTVLRVELPHPIEPGATVALSIDWFQKLRRFVDDSGYAGEHYEFAAWYPKLAARHSAGFDAEPAHGLGGEFGELATFDVSLTVPRELVVVATGLLTDGDPGWAAARERAVGAAVDEMPPAVRGPHKTVAFHAEQVFDFAWVADPAFACVEGPVGAALARVFYHPDRGAPGALTLLRTTRAFEWLAARFGPYAYPELNVVASLVASGESHPMLVLLGDERESVLSRQLAAQFLTVAVESDGVNESWIDSALEISQTRRYMRDRYGPAAENPDDLGRYIRGRRRPDAREAAVTRMMRLARLDKSEPVATPGHLFRDLASHPVATEDKASVFVDMLQELVGEARFDGALAAYLERYRHHQVGEAELLAAFTDATDGELAGVFDQWLHGIDTVDFAVTSVATTPTAEGYRVTVAVSRRGGLSMPTEVLVRARDGSEQRVSWPAGETTEASFQLELPEAPAEVWIDPAGVAPDPNRRNNRSPRSLRLAVDWPFDGEAPRAAYQVTWRPSLWYNLVDGARVGGLLEGSREGVFQRLRIAPSLDLKRGRVDFDARLSTPLHALGRSDVEVRLAKMEGRRLLSAVLRTALSPRLERRPQTHFEAGISHFLLTEPSYVRADRFDAGRVNQLWLRYGGEYAGSGWIANTDLKYQVAGPQLDSAFAYNRLSLSAAVRADRGPTSWTLRTFVGLSSDGDTLPRQERFYLAGAGAMAEFDNPGLRSEGSLLRDLNYHLPGDGNLRAYLDSEPTLSARRLLAINLETERRLPNLGATSRWRSLLGTPAIALFGDVGKAEGTGVSNLTNFMFGLGAGIRLYRTIEGKEFVVRLDSPFYINRPGLDLGGSAEARAKLRWVLSFSPAFSF